MPRFKYTPLTSARDEIRLLSLDPSGDLDDIRCTLETHRLDARPVYFALSYEWGDPDLAVDIKVNGNVFQARHNLWLFLHRLKAARSLQSESSWDLTSKLWIDALCIDQTNVAERSAQVHRMGRIYQKAYGVIVWLGWADELDPNVTSTLTRELRKNPTYMYQSTTTDLLFNGTIQESYLGKEAAIQEIYAFILELCQKRYWTRRWIVQEILMAQRVLLVYGEQELPWAVVCMLLKDCEAYTRWMSDFEVPLPRGTSWSSLKTILDSTMAKICGHQDRRKGSNSIATLATLLRSYRSMQCDSVHDRVYALKGLTENDLLDTDYSLSPPELYSRVFTLVLRQDRYAFRDWRDYAADCGLVVQPLSPIGTMPQEHHFPVGASVPLRTTTEAYVISKINFATFQRGVDKLAGGEHTRNLWRGLSGTTISSGTETQDIFQEFWLWLGSDLPLNTFVRDKSQTAVARICIDEDKKFATHGPSFDGGRLGMLTTANIDDDSQDANTNSPTIMFCSAKYSEDSGYLSVTWSDAKPEDFLCQIVGYCYLILRPNGGDLQIVGPAWKLCSDMNLAVLANEIRSGVLQQPDTGPIETYQPRDHISWPRIVLRMSPKDKSRFSRYRDRALSELDSWEVEVQINVMELVQLLQVTERLMKVSGSSSWDFPDQTPLLNQHE